MLHFSVLETSIKVLRIINNCIEAMIDYALSLIEDSDKEEKVEFLESFFPKHLCRQNIEKCINTLHDLQDWTRDNYLHELTGLHEYVLFRIFQDFFNQKDDFERFRKKGQRNIFKFYVKDIENYEPDEIEILKQINNRSFYEGDLFWDWDFLFIDSIVNLYQTDINTFNSMGVDLRDYLDLMPNDIRKQVQASLEAENIQDCSEEFIITQISNVIKQMELDPVRLEKYTEDEISDDIKSRMQFALELKNIIIEREARGGFAEKEIGEIDFFLYQNYEHRYIQLALGENKVWGKFENQLKQLLGYSNKNINFGFTITINREKTYQEIKESQLEILQNFNCNNNFPVSDIQEKDDMLVSIHSIPEQNKSFKIYHFILNANGQYRKDSAIQARKNSKKDIRLNIKNNSDKKIDSNDFKDYILDKIKTVVTFDDMIDILNKLKLIENEECLAEVLYKFQKISTQKSSRSKLIIDNIKYSNIQIFSANDTPIMGFCEKIKNLKETYLAKIYATDIINRYKLLDISNNNVINKDLIIEAIALAQNKFNFLELFNDKKVNIFISNKGMTEYRSYLYKNILNTNFEIYIYPTTESIFTTLYQLGLIIDFILCNEDEIIPKTFIKAAKKIHLDLLKATKEDRVIMFSEIFATTALRNTPLSNFVSSIFTDDEIKLLENYFIKSINDKILTKDYSIKNITDFD